MNTTYTYRNGEKLELTKSPDEFVVRTAPINLPTTRFSRAEQVSPASFKLTTNPADLDAAMAIARETAVAHHAYYTADTDEEFLITDRVFVTFKATPTTDELDVFSGRYGLVKKEAYGDKDFLFQLTEHTGMNPVRLVTELTEKDDSVERAENDLNHRANAYQFQPPVDPSYNRQWHLHNHFNHPAFDTRASARCEDAWRALDHFGSFDVVVGVTDDGCKVDHPDFNSPGKFAGWGYFRGSRLVVREDIDANPAQMYIAGANHGTSCAGVIAGEADAVHTVGAAPGCRLLPIQWESDGPYLQISDSKLLTALTYVGDKVDVLSNSWGSTPTTSWPSTVLNKIRQLALNGGRRGKGILFLWAAGNENCPIQHDAAVDVPHDDGWQQNADGSWSWVGVRRTKKFRNNLVGIPGVVHVAALASNARRSHYSNYGTGIGICAPSSNVHTYHRLTVAGLGITTATGSQGGVTEAFGGTSSATPLVAGIAALVISANPNLSAVQIISLLQRTASKNLSVEGYAKTPPASYDPSPTWDVSPVAPFNSGAFSDIGSSDGTWSPWFGHGRADAAAAVVEALRLTGGSVGTTPVYRKSATPALAIPDNSATGIKSPLVFTDIALIGSVKVAVDITHSYIGDLQVTLVAPNGSSVVLHNRSGSSTKNLKKSFDTTTTPALAGLTNLPVQGEWALHIQDLAAVDTGVLNQWELEITGKASSALAVEEAPGISIPDNNSAGIERSLQVTASGTVANVSVSVDITHGFISDLSVTLIPPAGASIPLHARSGGSQDNIIKTYTPATTPALASLRGLAAQGAWRLRVADVAASDTGKLNRWKLQIETQ